MKAGIKLIMRISKAKMIEELVGEYKKEIAELIDENPNSLEFDTEKERIYAESNPFEYANLRADAYRKGLIRKKLAEVKELYKEYLRDYN